MVFEQQAITEVYPMCEVHFAHILVLPSVNVAA